MSKLHLLTKNLQIRKNSTCDNCSPFAKITYMPVDLVTTFIQTLFKKLQVNRTDSSILTECIIEADIRGNFPHGVFSLPKYVNAINNGTVNVNIKPKIIFENIAMATVCGANALGPIVGSFCMNLAIEKAKDVGVACVSANFSNYFGMAGYYSLLAMRECLIGISMTNTPPVMIPANGACPVLGSNPIAFYADAGPHEVFALDIATTKMSREKIEWLAANCEKLKTGVALNLVGNETNVPKQALMSNKLFPFYDQQSFGLACAIEILTGVLTGANFSRLFNKRDHDDPMNIGHFFIAVDPAKFNMDFDEYLTEFNCNIRNTEPQDPAIRVRVPGDAADLNITNAYNCGIPYNRVHKDIFRCYAIEYNINYLNDYIH